MPNIRRKIVTPHANAARPDVSVDTPASSAKSSRPSDGGSQKAGEAPVKRVAEQTSTPAAAKRAKIPQKPKWVSALPAPTPARKPRSSVGRAKPEALDEWVNALPSSPPEAAAETPSIRSAADAQATKVEAPRPAADKLEPAAAPQNTRAASTAARSVAKRALRGEPSTSPTAAAPSPAPAVAPPSPAAPKVAEPAPAVAKSPTLSEAHAPPSAPAASAEPSPPPQAAPAPPAFVADPAAGGAFGFGAYYPFPDNEALARNIGDAIEHAGRAVAAYLRPRETGEVKTTIADEIGEMVRSLGHVAEYYMSDPARAIEAQTALTTQFIDLWAATLQRFQGMPARTVAEPDRSDKRFSDAEWSANPFFDFLKQAYVLTTRWADDLISRADELEPHKRRKAQFYLRQVTAALAPSNFIGTNPELIRATLAESGANLARGLKMLAEDIEAGKGNLRIRQSDARGFKLGVNMATTPGKVIFRNELIELIQYEPTTAEAYRRPLLIVPPWINKFYILDLNPEKSAIRWAVSQGLTVFVISWVNPDSRHADMDFAAYMHEGVLTALDCVEQATGEREVAAIGYCVGGTLLAATLGYMAAIGDKRINSATFFAALVDFTDPGDLQVFIDAAQLRALEERMAEQGYLEGSAMANTFNMLRPNDLIWSYYVNNYLKGREPIPFDLLVWNSDSTRMPAANHSFYLRHCYLQNDLSNGRMVLSGKTIDLGKVTMPIYELAAREDHIAPARGVFKGAKCFGGPVRFVLAGSGHIAGVVNPAETPKYQYWTNGPVEGDLDSWLAKAMETPGSWWPDWIKWITAQAPEKVLARNPGAGALKAICDAPGEYVRMKA
jgi:poly[(R)-3-hydroxyalkanoate] polymerase subunit PhaC